MAKIKFKTDEGDDIMIDGDRVPSEVIEEPKDEVVGDYTYSSDELKDKDGNVVVSKDIMADRGYSVKESNLVDK